MAAWLLKLVDGNGNHISIPIFLINQLVIGPNSVPMLLSSSLIVIDLKNTINSPNALQPVIFSSQLHYEKKDWYDE